jgi:PAS domain S-box-containing protein
MHNIQAETLFKAFIDNPLHSVFVVDKELNILEFNQVAAEQLSILRKKPLKKGESFLNLVQPENLEKTLADLKSAFQGEMVTGQKLLTGIIPGYIYSTKFCYQPLKDTEGNIPYLVLTYVDITAENLAFKKAERYSNLLDLLFEQSHEGLLVVDMEKLDFKANPEFYRIFDLTPETLSEEIARLGNPGNWDPSFPFSIKHSFSIPLKKDTQFQVLRSGPNPTYVKIYRNELQGKNGSKILLLSIKDESEYRISEKKQIENELSFKVMAKNFPNGNISVVDKDLNIIFTDGVEYETDLETFTPEQGKSILSQYGQNYGDFIKESLVQGFEGISEQFELKFKQKTFSILVTPVPDSKGQIKSVMKIAQNVSDQKNAQLEAHYQRESLRQILDVDPNLIYVKDQTGKVLMANKSVAAFFGTSVSEFIENSNEYFKTYKWRYEEIYKLDEQIFKTLKTKTTEEAIFNKESKKMHLFQITRTPFVSQGNELSILCVGVDITDRVNAENELITQREYLRHILDTDPNIIFVKDNNGKFLLVNKAFAEYYKTQVESIIGKTDKELHWAEEDWKHFERTDKEVIHSSETKSLEEYILNPITGEGSHYVVTKKPLLDADGNISILGVVTDITNQKKQEEKIRKSEEMLQEIFNRVEDALLIIDFNTLKILDCNQKAVSLLKAKEKATFIGNHLSSISINSDPKKNFWTTFIKKFEKGNPTSEVEIVTEENTVIWGSLAATVFFQDGKNLMLLRIADVTLRKTSEDQIIQALHEKEILIQEIHHRVKNNMAVISSLLQLQTGYIKDPALINVFKDSQSRIKSMALIHEKLYQSKALAKVEMESYIKELTRTLLYSYNSRSADIQIITNIDNVYLDINSAVPCGLLINEIISNACKHAFVGKDKGTIHINFSKRENQFHLEMQDDGIGMPQNTNFSDFKSLGMNLVQALASQLGAQMEVKTSNGLGFYLTFIEKTKPNRADITNGKSNRA